MLFSTRYLGEEMMASERPLLKTLTLKMEIVMFAETLQKLQHSTPCSHILNRSPGNLRAIIITQFYFSGRPNDTKLNTNSCAGSEL
jgi:hypothetical protein